jgi:thiol:disulfide interchange protein
MKPSPIPALIFTTLLAGMAAAAAEPQTPLTAHQSSTTGLTWLTNLQSAQTRAKAEKKSVLLFFHGSDWCPTCVEMQRQVFDSPAFAQYARQALVLVDVDFPDKHKQDEGLRRANVA